MQVPPVTQVTESSDLLRSVHDKKLIGQSRMIYKPSKFVISLSQPQRPSQFLRRLGLTSMIYKKVSMKMMTVLDTIRTA